MKLLHHGKPDTLGNTAFDLPLHEHRIDGLANVMRGRNFQEAYCAEVAIDLELDHVRFEAVHCVRIALAFAIERRTSLRARTNSGY